MALGTLLIRADASSQIGAGHVMRCIALAQAWSEAGGKAAFVLASTIPLVTCRLEREGFEYVVMEAKAGSREDSTVTRSIARDHHAQWIALDGYHFDDSYCERIRSRDWKLLRIDDGALPRNCPADLILNQNFSSKETTCSAGSKPLFGLRYALLRREFANASKFDREIAPLAKRLLITAGGGDFTPMLKIFLKTAESISRPLEIRVILPDGAGPQDFEPTVSGNSPHAIQWLTSVQDMAPLIKWADVALSAAGSTCWEFCALGLPALVVDIAANQRCVAETLGKYGAAVHIPMADANSGKIGRELDSLIQSPQKREEISRLCNKLVDGLGARRVVSAMRALGLEVRRATLNDAELLWTWANDSEVRAASFQPKQISWDEHQQWFRARLANDSSTTLLAEESGTPIAVFRVELNHARIGTASVTFAPELRGSGLASHVIEKCSRRATEELQLVAMHALIKSDNGRSIRAFESAGFVFDGLATEKGPGALRYIRAASHRELLIANSAAAVTQC